MSDQKRVALTTLSTNKCDKKSGKGFGKTVRLNISLIEPNENSCSVFDYTTLLNAAEKKRLKKKQQSEPKVNGAVDPFDAEDDEDVKRIARQFEEKYGGSDRHKQNRCQTYSELGAGYDEEDSFIDNTDACDEALPEEMQTVHGGYYVNSGPLEFKRVELSDADDFDEIKGRKKKFGANVIRDDSESEDEEDDEDDEDDEDEEEDDEDEVEIAEEVNGKENGEVGKVEEKVNNEKKEDKVVEEVDSATTVKKMKITEKTEEKPEIAVTTKSEPPVLNHEDATGLKKKRKKRTLTVAERQQIYEEQLQDEQQVGQEIVNSLVTVPTIPLQTVSNAISNNSNKANDVLTPANNPVLNNCSDTAASVTKNNLSNSSVPVTAPSSQPPVVTNSNNNSNGSSLTNSPTNSLAPSQQNNTSAVKQHKKKTLTVKALLEEKRGSLPGETSNIQSSANDAIATTTAVTTATTTVTTTATTATASSNGNSVVSTEVKKTINQHTSVNDVIEFVISSARDGDSSKDSSSSNSKSQLGALLVCTDSDLSTESSDSQMNRTTPPANSLLLKSAANNAEVPPVPDNLPSDVLDLINSIKVFNAQSDNISKRNFPDDINNMLISLEKKSQSLTSANRNIIYEHLAGYLPCSKFTLMKRVKKLYFDYVEEEMNEPIRKLKTAIDTIMPSLLEKYSKDCQNIAAEKSNNEPPSSDVSGEGIIKTKLGVAKIPRRKFVWDNELRLYVREIIELRNQCYLIRNPRRESRDAYISSYLTSKIQPLWPPGWMKTSMLLREAGEVPTLRNKKKMTPTISPPRHPLQLSRPQSPQPPHSQQQQTYNQQKSPIQSLLNVSLPSSTTLTPTVVGGSASTSYSSIMQDRSNLNQPKRSPITITPNQVTVSVSSPLNTSSPGVRATPSELSALSRISTASTTIAHQTPLKTQKMNPSKPSTPKKSVSPSSNTVVTTLSNANAKSSITESQNVNKEQFPLYNLVKTSGSFKPNETEIEVMSSNNNSDRNNLCSLLSNKMEKKYMHRKFDISANNSSSSMSLLTNNKESNTGKQDRDRHNLQTPFLSSDLTSNSAGDANKNSSNPKSNKAIDKIVEKQDRDRLNLHTPFLSSDLISNSGGNQNKNNNHKSNKTSDKIVESANNNVTKKNKLSNDSESKNKNNITLNGSVMSFIPSSSSSSVVNPNSSLKTKREIKTEDVNISVNSSNNNNRDVINIDSILDLSSSNCGSSRTDNSISASGSVINKLNSNKSVLKNVTSVNERTSSVNSGSVLKSEPPRMPAIGGPPAIGGSPAVGSQDLNTMVTKKDQKSPSISPVSNNSNISALPNGNKKLQNPSQPSPPVRSLKQRILQDQQMSASTTVENNLKRSSDDAKSNTKTSTQSNNCNTNDLTKKIKIESPVPMTSPKSVLNKPLEVKTEIKNEVKLETNTPAPSPASAIITSTIDFEHQMTLETVTATDILSQLINESLLGTPHHHEEVVVQTSPMEDIIISQQHQICAPAASEGIDKDCSNRDRRNSTASRHQRLPSGDHEAKMQMEVDQVIQDLAMLRQMSGCGNSNTNSEDVPSQKTPSGHKTMSSSPFFSSSSCSSTSSFSLSSDVKKSGQTVSSYQNEFYKHLMQKESVSPPPSSTSPAVCNKQDNNVSRHHSFQNSFRKLDFTHSSSRNPFPSDNILDDIPNKYSSISVHSISGQNKQNSPNSRQTPLNQQSPSQSSVGQLTPNSPGVIQHRSSPYHHQTKSSHNQYQLHSQSVLPARNKNEDYHSVLTKSSSQPYNRFDWSLTGNGSPPSLQ